MDKLLRLVDVSLVTTIVSGLLYVMGYKYYYYYYTYFGINLLVRDPETVYVFTKGFDYSGHLFIVILLVALAYLAATHILTFLNRKTKLPTQTTIQFLSAVASFCAFNLAFASLLDHIQASAIKNANLLSDVRNSREASITLQGGDRLPGKFSFFFLNEKNVVLFNTSMANSKKPKLIIIPSSNVKFIEVN